MIRLLLCIGYKSRYKFGALVPRATRKRHGRIRPSVQVVSEALLESRNMHPIRIDLYSQCHFLRTQEAKIEKYNCAHVRTANN